MFAETLGAIAGGYALLLGGLTVFQRDMIYHPGDTLPSPDEAGVPEMLPVPVRTTDNLVVSGWYAPPTRSGAETIVYCHGNARTLAHRAHKARLLLDAGYGVFLVGYRGYGGNPGRPSEAGLYADTRAVLGWLIGRGIHPERLVLYGESLGTGIVAQMATEQPEIAALILEAPFTRLAELTPLSLVPGLLADHYDTITKIPAIRRPMLVLHGEMDGVVPVAMGRKLVEVARGRARGHSIANGGHTNLWDMGAGDTVLAFLQQPDDVPAADDGDEPA